MKKLIAKLLKKTVPLKEKEIYDLIEIPPYLEMGDYAFPCFRLKKSPNQIADKIRLPKEIEKIEVNGAYLNFFVNKKILAEKILKDIKVKDFGRKKYNLNGMIEFSQANTHKAFHVGHIRGTSIGESLARIAEFYEEKVIRVNYQGDTGMHVAKWIWCYNKYHSKEKIKKDESWIAGIYVDAIKRLTKNPKLQEQVDEINRKLEEKKDRKLMDLWKKTRKLSLDSLRVIYKDLNTHFDKYYFESKLEREGKKISRELVKKKIAKVSDGAVIVDLKKYNLGIWVLLRKDGTVLYSAKDLALAKKKFKDYNLDWSVYVVANSQNLHLKQLFKTLELMNFKGVKKICFHVNYDLVRLPTGKMSSRTGENILYSDFKKEIFDYAKKEIKKRFNLNKAELNKRALVIAISAIKYSMLKQEPNKPIVFNKEQALNFEGDTGPYLLYSYARASSILRKAKSKTKFKILELEPEEIKLIKKLSQFPEIVLKSYNQLNPSHIANYSYQISKIFNEFYHQCPVIKSKQKNFRIALVESFRYVLKNSLNLLGIGILEKM